MSNPGQTRKKIVIIGAGIAGLACAFKLRQSQAFRNGHIDLTVLEASGRAGGIIETIDHDGCLLESGPDSFITNKPYMIDLAARLGISKRIIGTEESNRGAMIVSRGRLVKLPEGFNLMAPSKILPFLESPIMSWPGKMRVLAEPFLPVRSSKQDESVADFVRRRFGRELLAKVVQPMIGGIYVGDVEKLSVSMAAERFVALEQTSGSVIGGLMRQATMAENGSSASANSTGSDTGASQPDRQTCPANAPQNNSGGKVEHGVRYGLFSAFDRGMSVVIDTLLQKLEGVSIRLNTKVLGMHFSALPEGRVSWKLDLEGSALEADQVILALPAAHAGQLLGTSAPALSNHLMQIEAASSVVVNFILDKKDIAEPIEAFGVVVPEVEKKKLGLNVIALSFASHKFKDRAPVGKLVVRAFMGGVNHPALLDQTDEQLADLAISDMRRLLGYASVTRPQFVRVCRWPMSMPQFHVGHRDLLAKIELALAETPGLFLAGASYRGVGLPECVNTGELCAEKILQAFT